jgi:6-phosphogluconolactonase
VAPTKAQVPETLNAAIVQLCHEAVSTRGVFTIALSGGSLPNFLSSLPESFAAMGVDPCWDKWHVLLADERCVPVSDADSNLGSLQEHFLSKTGIPATQIYGIDETLLLSSTKAVAKAYESMFRKVLSGRHFLDLAVLGFGPDGHTCSLFPNHALLQEYSQWVAPIEDSPKPPAKRITLTLKVLNELTRNVIFCGAGSSKEPILKAVFGHPHVQIGMDYQVPIQNDPPPYPCAMVDPLENLIWVVDKDAMPKTEGRCAL